MFKVIVFIPKENVERVKEAMFAAGAGKLGDYDCCSWQALGEGQFRPLERSHPTIGRKHCIEKVPEYRVEMLCEATCMVKVIAAMKDAHLYEEPAYEIVSLVDEGQFQ